MEYSPGVVNGSRFCGGAHRIMFPALGSAWHENRQEGTGAYRWEGSKPQKLFNLMVGYKKTDDTLPARLLTEPLREGEPVGRAWRRDPLLDDYYALQVRDAQGIPIPAKLRETRACIT